MSISVDILFVYLWIESVELRKIVLATRNHIYLGILVNMGDDAQISERQNLAFLSKIGRIHSAQT